MLLHVDAEGSLDTSLPPRAASSGAPESTCRRFADRHLRDVQADVTWKADNFNCDQADDTAAMQPVKVHRAS